MSLFPAGVGLCTRDVDLLLTLLLSPPSHISAYFPASPLPLSSQTYRSRDSAVLGSYDAKSGGKRGGNLAGNVPVADMSAASPYARDTLALTDRVLAFAALNSDPASSERIQV